MDKVSIDVLSTPTKASPQVVAWVVFAGMPGKDMTFGSSQEFEGYLEGLEAQGIDLDLVGWEDDGNPTSLLGWLLFVLAIVMVAGLVLLVVSLAN